MKLITKTILILSIYLFPSPGQYCLMAASGKSSPIGKTIFHSNKSEQIKEDCKNPRILKVPAEFPTIAAAVAKSDEGNWIIISPGTYAENEIEINKSITISSEWKLSGDESKIDKTIIDAEDKRLFIIKAHGVEVSGLRIINGDHTLDISAEVTISHNHFVNNLDGMSFESGGGGYAGYNIAENDRDDALDLDITVDEENSGSDILVEYNLFINSHDDGIEIRLFKPKNQNINYIIRKNQIIGSNNAGIQLISYDEFTGKVFDIHHNIFINCKTGLGCMGGAKTREDLTGASKMDERVYFYNNTIIGCNMGATGGNNIQAFNNLVSGNLLGGFKMFGPDCSILNNLFFRNAGNDFTEIDPAVIRSGNIFSQDPLIDENTYLPAENSLCIDAGIISIEIDGMELLRISPEDFTGDAPDLGAIERGIRKQGLNQAKPLQVDAGEDRVVGSAGNEIVLAGRIQYADDQLFGCQWKQEMGPAEAILFDPDKLVTHVKLYRQGIYQFSINCSDQHSSSSDFVTVRFINEGAGKQLFLSEGQINTIEAEDFAYAYGTVKKIGKTYIRLDGNEEAIDIAQTEYSVGMSQGNDYELWFLVKSSDRGEYKLQVRFNHKDIGEISVVKNKKFKWTKLPGKVTANPGEWQLLIGVTNGRIFLDKIIFSRDPDFIPR